MLLRRNTRADRQERSGPLIDEHKRADNPTVPSRVRTTVPRLVTAAPVSLSSSMKNFLRAVFWPIRICMVTERLAVIVALAQPAILPEKASRSKPL
jgi:hypothetical protein